VIWPKITNNYTKNAQGSLWFHPQQVLDPSQVTLFDPQQVLDPSQVTLLYLEAMNKAQVHAGLASKST